MKKQKMKKTAIINNNDLKFIHLCVHEGNTSMFWPLLDFTLNDNPI